MLNAVTDRTEITQCQKTLMNRLYARLPNREMLRIGHPGGSFIGEVHYDEKVWFSTKPIPNARVPRYWNAFGLGKREKGAQNIVVEINPPMEGLTAQVSGIFAQDDLTGDYAILHRGRVGGGRKGIGKNAFCEWFRGAWVEVRDSYGHAQEAILISRLESPNLVDLVLAFVREVAHFKKEASSGRLSRTSVAIKRPYGFSPEFHGKKTGHRTERLEYESFHGLVVNELEQVLRSKLGTNANIFNTRAIDLAVEINGHMTHLYEVKSAANTQSIYTGVGQIMVHSAGRKGVQRVFVIPSGELDAQMRNTLELIGIVVLEYRLVDGGIQFTL